MLASCGYDRHISLWNINSFEHIGGLQVSQEKRLHYIKLGFLSRVVVHGYKIFILERIQNGSSLVQRWGL